MKWRPPSLLPSLQHLRIALVFLVLAATGAQQLVAQSHSHAWGGAQHSFAAPGDDSHTQTHHNGLLCQIAAHAGAAAPPTVVSSFTVARSTVSFVASYHEADVPAVPSHAWQSRGPPAA